MKKAVTVRLCIVIVVSMIATAVLSYYLQIKSAREVMFSNAELRLSLIHIYQSYAEYYTAQALKQWLAFEKAISKKPQNSSYFYAEEEDGKTDFYYNYDGYYKGKTINNDLKQYGFHFDAVSVVEAAGTEDRCK